MASLKSVAMFAVLLFSLLSILLFIQHELHSMNKDVLEKDGIPVGFSSRLKAIREKANKFLHHKLGSDELTEEEEGDTRLSIKKLPVVVDTSMGASDKVPINGGFTGRGKEKETVKVKEEKEEERTDDKSSGDEKPIVKVIKKEENTEEQDDNAKEDDDGKSKSETIKVDKNEKEEVKGALTCNGKPRDSEVIYWKVVPGDRTYESPVTPHHGEHHDRYISFEYDNGGWNNVRMGLECMIVVAHAFGRTLVVPPQQHLYLLGEQHKDKEDTKAHDEMGFEDFFDIDLLRSHEGFHLLHMEEFLAKEGVTGGLKGKLPPGNSSEAWGSELWRYLNKVSDEMPSWEGHFFAMPDKPGNFTSVADMDELTKERYERFRGGRSPVFYTEALQKAHHIHVPAHDSHRILQHHYAFAFFQDRNMQSFYRRFVRDYMRYKDNIQCTGANLVDAVRADAKAQNPTGNPNGDYYALHIRRGDFQYKDVKIGAAEILENLVNPDGTPIIPPGSLVYLSTDDPDGTCKNCYAKRKKCSSYKIPKPLGCPDDPSWDAFVEFGWKIRFLKDYLHTIPDANPNQYGMAESIVCSRARDFAGTFYSTFTGYIHRLRGYHGLGENTYYHTTDRVFAPKLAKSVGQGFSREWRAGWTDDGGELI